jgi:pyocin large subunit-like protein
MDWGMNMKVVFLIGAASLALALGGCDAGPSATRSSASLGAPPAAGSPATASAGSPGGGPASTSTQTASTDPRDAPVPLASDGKPIWAPNKRHTAQENADYQFGRDGKDFSALTEADFILKVHSFVDNPPAGVQRVQRSNGDTLLYDPKTNTFAVVTSAGAPRAMFKPDSGAAYWRQQVERVNSDSHGDDNSQG